MFVEKRRYLFMKIEIRDLIESKIFCINFQLSIFDSPIFAKQKLRVGNGIPPPPPRIRSVPPEPGTVVIIKFCPFASALVNFVQGKPAKIYFAGCGVIFLRRRRRKI